MERTRENSGPSWQCGQPARPRHVEIEEEAIRIVLLKYFRDVQFVFHLSDDVNIFLQGEKPAEAVPKKWGSHPLLRSEFGPWSALLN